jgi:hypothetical protein
MVTSKLLTNKVFRDLGFSNKTKTKNHQCIIHASKILGIMTNYIGPIPHTQESSYTYEPGNKGNNTGKVVPVHTMKAYRGVGTSGSNHS